MSFEESGIHGHPDSREGLRPPASGRTFIVTGAGGSVGRAVVDSLVRRRDSVVAGDLRADDLADGPEVLPIELDVTDEKSWERAVAATTTRFGRLDGLVNVAGVIAGGTDSVTDLSLDEWFRILDVNLTGCFIGIRSVAPSMREGGRGGQIVNVSSASGLRGMASQCAYSTSKGALIALTRQCAVDLAPFDVTVNAVAPGVLESPMRGGLSSSRRQSLLDRQVVRRAVRPTEVAATILFLMSEDARIVTGEVVSIDGGWASSSV